MNQNALGEIKVLDLSQHISGPYCTKLLAALGAEVIKIEKPGEGDMARNTGPFLNDQPHPETSATFLYMNTNKQSITLDLEKRAGVDLFKKMVKDSDVLVENFKPLRMSDLGVDYGHLKEINPGLIMVSITDFGQTGPYRAFKGSRLVGYALSGYMYINGDPDREPLASFPPEVCRLPTGCAEVALHHRCGPKDRLNPQA